MSAKCRLWSAICPPKREIEARAKIRLAEEYDAAQDRGEVATRADQNLLPEEKKVTAADIGLTHKDIHEARQLRDAERDDPGIIQRTLDGALAAGEEPTKAKLRDRAIRRAGELLKQIEPQRGGDRKSDDYQSTAADTLISRKDAAEQAGMSKRQAVTAIRVANVPAADFERQVESDAPPTVTALAEQGKKPRPDRGQRRPAARPFPAVDRGRVWDERSDRPKFYEGGRAVRRQIPNHFEFAPDRPLRIGVGRAGSASPH